MQLTIHGTVHRLSAIRASPVYPSRVAFPPQLSGAIADPDGDEVDPTAYEWYEDGVVRGIFGCAGKERAARRVLHTR